MKHLAAALLMVWGGGAAADPAPLANLAATQAGQGGAVALAFGVAQGDQTDIAVTGLTQAGGTDAVAPDAPFHIGSISKSFTATLLMILSERGVIDFHAALADLLPDADLHPDWRDLRLTQILSHTAGLPANPSLAAAWVLPGQDQMADRASLLATVWDDPLPEPQGELVYSNFSYILAGHVAEVATGRAWEDLIVDEIAGPLGLTSLGFGPPFGPGVPFGHQDQGGTLVPISPDLRGADNPPVMGPAGTIHLSARDLVAWGQFHLRACRGEAALLSAAGCARLHQPVVDGYALGLGEFPLPGLGETALGHDGSNTLWYAILMLVPEHDLVMVVMQNDGRADTARAAALALAEWALQPAP